MLPPPEPRTADAVDPDAITDAVAIVHEFGRHAGRAWFAGAIATPARDRVVVYRRPHPDFDARVLSLVHGRARVELRPARFTRDELVDVREQVWSLDEVLDIETVVLPQDGSGLVVHVGGSVTRAQRELDRIAHGVAVALPPRGSIAVS